MIAAHWAVAGAILGIALLVLWAPRLAGQEGARSDHAVLHSALLVIAMLTASGPMAFVAMAIAALLHAHSARRVAATAALAFAFSALATAAAAFALWRGDAVTAFLASMAAITLRAGLVPLHAGTARLCERAPWLQTQQLATLVGLAVAHLRFTDHIALAFDLAPFVVRYGAAMTLLPALMALVQRDLRGFYRSASMMHGGMIIAALGAAGRGHSTAALMVVITIAMAMGGLGVMLESLEARVGTVALAGPGGRVQSFPRLAAAFLLFGGAGVAMPGTAGFIADDLLLHALWEESVIGTLTVILGSAILAVATLVTYSKVFLGRAVPSLAPDLGSQERWVAVGLVFVLVWLGVLPATLLESADPFLRAAGDAAAH
jgi:NADH:ubiquinone oxidoreductase subunit 4 (subunit M)